ncbi:MAG: hypothetical protein MJ201_05650, partial [Mycoplasmoidaceae bacterium]|nr:hypothetical protein [Mycoplasmoidaceae bacterium]
KLIIYSMGDNMGKKITQFIDQESINNIYDSILDKYGLMLDESQFLEYLQDFNGKLKVITYNKGKKFKQVFTNKMDIKDLIHDVIEFYCVNDWTSSDTSNKACLDTYHNTLHVCLEKNSKIFNRKFGRFIELFKEQYQECLDTAVDREI